jgi:GNAT superfamily N-acetyltransferase
MVPLTLANLGDLPATCRSCVVWELDATAAAHAARSGDTAFEKEAWLSSLLLTWQSAGRVAYVDEEPAGYVCVAPPVHVPRAAAFPTSPVSADAVLLVAGRVEPAHRGAGLARMLVQGVAKDLTQRGVLAVEAFARGGAAGEAGDASGGALRRHGGAGAGCLLPQGFYEAAGFTVVRAHHRFPRMRLELRSALAWREDVEAALEELLGSLTLARGA